MNKTMLIIKNNNFNYFIAKDAREAIELAYIFKKEIEVYNKGTFFVYKIDDERSEYQNRLFLENLMS